jgi:hypothetical protein
MSIEKDESLVTISTAEIQRSISLGVVQPRLQRLNIGDVDSFKSIATNNSVIGCITGVVWNEEKISLLTDSSNIVIQFYPEINPGVKLFLHRKESRRNEWSGEGPIVWNGEYDSVQFTKQNLIKFLKQYAAGSIDDILKHVKSTKITAKRVEDEEFIDLDGDTTRATLEESVSTNVPKKFTVEMPLLYNLDGTPYISTKLEFDVSVAKKRDDYGRASNTMVFELSCTNARKALQGMMISILEGLPSGMPKYYGARTVESQGRN